MAAAILFFEVVNNVYFIISTVSHWKGGAVTKVQASIATAIIDAIVSTVTVIITLTIHDPAAIQLIIPLIGSYQACAGAIIAALLITNGNDAKAAEAALQRAHELAVTRAQIEGKRSLGAEKFAHDRELTYIQQSTWSKLDRGEVKTDTDVKPTDQVK